MMAFVEYPPICTESFLTLTGIKCMNLLRSNFIVLLADDDPDEHARFVQAILANADTVHIDSSYNGMQLLNHMQTCDGREKKLPDVIITDLYMPFAGGLQVLKQIKTNIRFRQIPIIVFSKSFDKNIQSKVLGNGASEFYQKPEDYSELEKMIGEILIRHATADLSGH
jgi:CheY-like chemotaxis protein